MQLGWKVCNWRGRIGLICGSKTLGDDSKQNLVCNSGKIIVVRGSGYASNKNGDKVTLQKWDVYKKDWIYKSEKKWIEGYSTCNANIYVVPN